MGREWGNEPSESPENAAEFLQLEEEDDGDALSLSELPLSHEQSPRMKEETENINVMFTPYEFNFCPLLKQPEMCDADEVFFQGQILPLQCHPQSAALPVSRSEGNHYGGFSSSRSSRIGSHQSSRSSSAAAPVCPRCFHSLPSPSAGTTFHRITSSISRRNIAKWDILKLGLVTTPPENPSLDLSGRGDNSRDKKKPRSTGLGGCTCSAAVDAVIVKRSHVRRKNFIYTDVGESPATKKQLSRRRTFEWLKQASLEDDPPSSVLP